MPTLFDNVFLVEQLPHKATVVAASDMQIYIGTEDGHVLFYRHEETAPRRSLSRMNFTGTNAYHVTKKVLPSGKKIVESIEAIPSLKILVVLSDSTVFVLHMSTLDLLYTCPQAKKVKAFATNITPEGSFLFLSLKKKVMKFKLFEDKAEFIQEYNLPTSALKMACIDDYILFGTKQHIMLLHCATFEVQELQPLRDRSLLIRAVHRTKEFLYLFEQLGVMCSVQGIPSRAPLDFPGKPNDFLEWKGYVVSANSRGLDVYAVEEQKTLQTIAFPAPTSLSAGSKGIYVLSQTKLAYLVPVPLQKQIQEAIHLRQFKTAMKLLESREGVDIENVRRLTADVALALYCDLDFEKALEHFLKSDVDPRQLLLFFPDLLPPSVNRALIPSLTAKSMEDIIQDALSQGESSMTLQDAFMQGRRCIFRFLEIYSSTNANSKVEIQLVVHHALAKLYMENNQLDVLGKLLAGDNFCELPDFVPILTSKKLYSQLASFYISKGRVDDALSVWERLGTGAIYQANTDAITPSVSILSNMDNEETIFRYSSWIIKKKPMLGIKIFTSSARHNPLDVDAVLTYLEQFNNSTVMRIYLEYTVQFGKENEKFQNRLGQVMIEEVKSAVQAYESNPTREANNDMCASRERLQKYIRSASKLAIPVLLPMVQDMGLNEEAALLLEYSGQHEHALFLMVNHLHKYEDAVSYCIEKADPDEKFNSLLLKLVTILAQDAERYKNVILQILTNHAKLLDPFEVMGILPPEWSISEVTNFLTQSMRGSLHLHREGQVVRNLMKSENLRTRHELLSFQRQRFIVRSDSLCPVCNTKLGDKVCARFPTNYVVHFKCFRDRNVCPVTNRRCNDPAAPLKPIL
eukprot:TRINITY_DN5079_c0_g3_i1.p1 TRINITY_DN5079_c0_g3~~TRINITY_DN5079_c0_g3_i1.p1  ORF type:complete len:859 (-),score=160.74 TRINITY_DN5079_c0_g3_i1:239-2815(-)